MLIGGAANAVVILTNTSNAYSGGTYFNNATATLIAGSPGALGSGPVTLPVGPTLSLSADGDGLGAVNVAGTYSTALIFTGTSANLAVGRAGVGMPLGSLLFTQAANKYVDDTQNFTFNGFTLNVANNNGYGLNLTGSVSLSGVNTFSVANATASNVTPGLTLSGIVSGTAGLVKTGAGTLVLANTGNTFGSSTSVIDIQGGMLAASSSAVFGNAANTIKLDSNSQTQGFRATSSYSLGRTFTLAQGANDIEVTTGNTLTLTAPFSVSAGTNALYKNDNGTLVLSASNPSTWTGGIVVSAGILQISNSNQLGAATAPLTVGADVGAAVQLFGGITIPNPVNLNNGGNFTNSGINTGGNVESVSGNNTILNEMPAFGGDTSIGSDSGSTLNLAGVTTTGHILQFVGGGNFNIAGGSLGAMYTINKLGAGTLTVQVPVGGITNGNLNVYGGTFVLSGSAGALNTGGAADSVNFNPGTTLTLNDSLSTTTVANRLGGHVLSLTDATFNYIANGNLASSEWVLE